MSIQLNLVNNTDILYTDERGYNSFNDPFTNGDVNVLINEVRSVLRNELNPASYDIGHVLGASGGGFSGNAYVGVVCETAGDQYGPYKGGGATLVDQFAPIGNDEDAGMIAHSIGHQFGATHTFNTTTAPCAASRSAATAWESGGGLTLMSNAGGRSPDWIAFERYLMFHSGSFEQIQAYVGAFGGCATTAATGNAVPAVNGGADYTIPKNTPFVLAASTTSVPDAGETFEYAWEQIDAGGSYPNPPYEDQTGDPASTTRPIFRPFAPGTNPSRIFPSPIYILNDANDPPPATASGLQTAEELPRVGRQMDFRVTIRDGRGGVSNDSVKIVVDGGAGPFLLTAPNTNVSWTGNTTQTVTWNVNNTAGLAANVSLSLSTDGGNTFPIVLAASTPNDGSQTITVPSGLNTTTARVKVEAVGNIFFDVSNANFTLTPGAACVNSISPMQATYTTSGGSGTINVTADGACTWAATSSAGWITITGGASGSGNSTVNYSVASHTNSASRIGTITIAGQIFTVTQLGTTPSPGLAYYPLPRPIRLFDTRQPFPGFKICNDNYLNAPLIADQERAFQATGNCNTDGVITTIPTNALAIVGNAAIALPSADGVVATWPNGQPRPSVSNMNFVAGQTIPNAFTVGLGTDGKFRVILYSGTAAATAHFIVDVVGYYAPPAAGGLYFHPLSRPIRLYDTRSSAFPACDSLNAPILGGQELERPARITCDGITIPAEAQVITGSATVNSPQGPGYVVLFPNGEPRPSTSHVNYESGQTATKEPSQNKVTNE